MRASTMLISFATCARGRAQKLCDAGKGQNMQPLLRVLPANHSFSPLLHALSRHCTCCHRSMLSGRLNLGIAGCRSPLLRRHVQKGWDQQAQARRRCVLTALPSPHTHLYPPGPPTTGAPQSAHAHRISPHPLVEGVISRSLDQTASLLLLPASTHNHYLIFKFILT